MLAKDKFKKAREIRYSKIMDLIDKEVENGNFYLTVQRFNQSCIIGKHENPIYQWLTINYRWLWRTLRNEGFSIEKLSDGERGDFIQIHFRFDDE